MPTCDKCQESSETLCTVGPFKICVDCFGDDPAAFGNISALYD